MSRLNKQQLINKQQKSRKPINGKKILIVVTMIAYMIVQVAIALLDAKPTEGSLTLNQVYEMIEKEDYNRIN